MSGISFGIEIDPSGLDAGLRQAEARIDAWEAQVQSRVEGKTITMPIDFDTRQERLAAAVGRVETAMARRGIHVPVEFDVRMDRIDAAVASWEAKRAVQLGHASPLPGLDLPDVVAEPIEKLETLRTKLQQVRAEAVAKAIQIDAGIETDGVKKDAADIAATVAKLNAQKVTIPASVQGAPVSGTLPAPNGSNPLGLGATAVGAAAVATAAKSAELSLAGVARAGTTALAAITAIELASEGIPTLWHVIKGDVEKAAEHSERFRKVLEGVPIVGGVAVKFLDKMTNSVTALAEGLKTGNFTGWATQAAEARAYAEELDKQTEKLRAIGEEMARINGQAGAIEASARDEFARAVLSPAEFALRQAQERTRQARALVDQSKYTSPSGQASEDAKAGLEATLAAERRAGDVVRQERARIEAETQDRVRAIVVEGEEARLRAANRGREADRLAFTESLRHKLEAAKSYEEELAQIIANGQALAAFDAETKRIEGKDLDDIRFQTRQTRLRTEGQGFQAEREAVQRSLNEQLGQVRAGDFDTAFALRERAKAQLDDIDKRQRDLEAKAEARAEGKAPERLLVRDDGPAVLSAAEASFLNFGVRPGEDAGRLEAAGNAPVPVTVVPGGQQAAAPGVGVDGGTDRVPGLLTEIRDAIKGRPTWDGVARAS